MMMMMMVMQILQGCVVNLDHGPYMTKMHDLKMLWKP